MTAAQHYWLRHAMFLLTSAAAVMLLVLAWLGETNPVVVRQADVDLGRPSPYIGSAACAECHEAEARHHARTGHAATFATAARSPLGQRMAGRTFDDPERDITYGYELDSAGLWITTTGAMSEYRLPLQYALGSGHHAVTFLTLLKEVPQAARSSVGDAELSVGLEHRVTYFGGEDRLGLTPGHAGEPVLRDADVYGRAVRGETLVRCISCHTTTATLSGDSLVDLRAGVGCESCHGAGRAHVEARRERRPGPRMLFGPHAAGTIDEIRLCGRCHRLPDEFPPEQLRRQNADLARFQPAGLLHSDCFSKSDSLRCSTCHDPHHRVLGSNEFDPMRKTRMEYELNCLECHRRSHPCPVSPRANCIGCHMPPVEVHGGIAFHDHWIRVRGAQDPSPADAGQLEDRP